jgi:signal transduction histidine kinase
VVLFKKENRIILEVEDNGIGLSDEDMFKGSGISNLKYRANKIEAILTNETAEPSGTRWRLEIKL